MSGWDTTYSPEMSPFSFNLDDSVAGLSPFGKKLGVGLSKGLQGVGAAMSGGQGLPSALAQGVGSAAESFTPPTPEGPTGDNGAFLAQRLAMLRQRQP